MAPKRGFLRRLVDRILGTTPKQVPPKPPVTPPTLGPTPVTPAAPNISQLRTQAINNIMTQTAFAKRDTVIKGVSLMSIDELRWTIRATYDQIANAARQLPDRLRNGIIPWNPWWYQ